MKVKHLLFQPRLIGCLLLIIPFTSCKKDKTVTPVVNATPVSLGLYEYASGVDKRVLIAITKIGTQTVNYGSIFDTGSPGMTMDATGIIPASMITSAGIQVTGDSTVVNGITITSKTSTISYGDATGTTIEYGNLAYANVTVGNSLGSMDLKRVPFFLYYKIVDSKKNQLAAHSADVFGVGPGLSSTITTISSPLRFYTYGTGLTSGFKLTTLNIANFLTSPTYTASLLTVGLTSADLKSSGFIMHTLSQQGIYGYSPNIPGTITYNGQTISAELLFDTGTPSVTTIENRLASVGALPTNTTVTLTTNQGFTYTYVTTNTGNLTEVQNPNNTQDYRTIFSLDFFIYNEFLTDYGNHQIGLKNN
ncbi:hypothetical protein [Mucilaginibacter sp. FT3.2]|uniref:hypothetical protein n=1 Tax=Mucilaginibacter sp. FT3.2 TaxID=2723090 RepID=UPI00160B7967|nr:hypothetical protein [Mucilaginibacter sp. FT3.2]MBB6231593.1 hypothetical protein [Mucilaginibacter sp. FT3.2]